MSRGFHPYNTNQPGTTNRRVIGSGPAMQKVYELTRQVARSNASVLLLGETGTGKELIAAAVHQLSPRANRPYVRVNCGALTESLLESELFGHVRGSFTGAIDNRTGRFEAAHTGTVFLDEINSTTPKLQVKLLRVLQEREFERVGGEATVHVDVRVIAATNRVIRDEVAAGRFREDLFYRLYVIPIHLPPLRERKEDIPLLVDHFVQRLCTGMGRPPLPVEDAALRLLSLYDWPGNVRELENALERAIVLCEGDRLSERDLPFLERTRAGKLELPAGVVPLEDALDHLERTLLARALEASGGVKAEAARRLGIKPSALYYKLEKHGLL